MDIYQILRVKSNTNINEIQMKYLRLLDAYQLVRDFSDEPDVVEIAQNKIEQLKRAGGEARLSSDLALSKPDSSTQESIAAIRLALNSSRSDAKSILSNRLIERVNGLDNSSEKHYLKSILILKTDSSINGLRLAVESLHRALNLDPTNSAYQGLVSAIEEQIDEYVIKQKMIASEQEKERAAQEVRAQQAIIDAQTKKFWNSVSDNWMMYALGLCCCYCCVSIDRL
jgi:hypothetical protein